MTLAALVLAVDALTAAFLLGLVHCRDVTRHALPRRTPGQTLLADVPPEVLTIGQRRRITPQMYYRQKFGAPWA